MELQCNGFALIKCNFTNLLSAKSINSNLKKRYLERFETVGRFQISKMSIILTNNSKLCFYELQIELFNSKKKDLKKKIL